MAKKTVQDQIVITEAVQAFLDAQTALIDATGNADAAFAHSAISTYQMLAEGLSLRALGKLNADENGNVSGEANTRYLYTSAEQLTIHGLTGALFLCESDDEDPYVPSDVQTIVNRVKRIKGVGVDPVRAIVESAESIADGIEKLEALEVAQKAANKLEAASVSADTSGGGEDSEGLEDGLDGDVPVTLVGAPQTPERHLADALAMFAAGAEVTDAAMELIEQLMNVAADREARPALTVVA